MRFLRPYWPRVLGASAALVFTASVTLSLGQGLRMLVDQGFVSGSAEQLNRAVLVFMLIVLLLAIGTFTRFYLVSWIGERVTADLRRAVFDHVLSLHPGFFETNGAGEIQSRITADTTLLQTVIGSSVSIALRNLLTLAGGVVLLFVSNPRLTGIVLLSVPLVLLPIVVFGRRVRTLSRDSQDRLANAGAYLSEALGNIKTVQAFNHEGVDRERFAMHVEDTFRASIRRVVQRSWLTAMVIVLVLGAVGAMIWVGGNDVIAGRTTPGELTAFIFYAVMVAAAAGALSEVIGDLQRAAGATERLMELLRETPLIRAPAAPLPLPARLRGEIELPRPALRVSLESGASRDRRHHAARAGRIQRGAGGRLRRRQVDAGRPAAALLRTRRRQHPGRRHRDARRRSAGAATAFRAGAAAAGAVLGLGAGQHPLRRPRGER